MDDQQLACLNEGESRCVSIKSIWGLASTLRRFPESRSTSNCSAIQAQLAKNSGFTSSTLVDKRFGEWLS